MNLCLVLGEEEETKKYVDEVIDIQNCKNSIGGVLYVTATFAELPCVKYL